MSLDAECKKVCETIASTVKTFPQAIKTALVNSNKKEYLTTHEGKFVPLTTKINRDITILQKYYNGKIPSDIEQKSSLFPAIIAEANKELSVKSFTIEQQGSHTALCRALFGYLKVYYISGRNHFRLFCSGP